MNKIKKKHHYIPKFYLAGFTKKGDVDSTLWVFDQETGNQWDTKPKNIGFEKDIYTVDVPDTPKDIIEDIFMEIENKCAPIIKNIISRLEIPKDEEYNWLINYIALQYVRTPKRKEAFTKPIEEMSKLMMKMVVSTPESYRKVLRDMGKDEEKIDKEVSYDELRDFIMNEDRYKIEVDNNTKINNMMAVIDAIIPYLGKRRWSVIYCPPPVGDLICSDNPVNLHWTTNKERGFFNSPGHGLPDTEITIPLSSRVMLLGRFDIDFPLFYEIKVKRNLAILNSFTGINSERFIYSRKEDFYWLTSEGKIGNTDDFKRMIVERNRSTFQ